jgi:hypothetical protein
MAKPLFNKYLITNLVPFCFRLCLAVFGCRLAKAETTGNNRTQRGHRNLIKSICGMRLKFCVRDSAGGK